MSVIPDTSVIIDNPRITLKENTIIPYCVLAELDNLKRNSSVGHKVRKASHLIINNHIPTKSFPINCNSTDDKLIELATDGYTVLTNDLLMYLKGQARGATIDLVQEDNDLYTGIKEVNLPQECIDQLYNHNSINFKNLIGENPRLDLDLYENQFLDAGQIMARYHDNKLYPLDWNTTVEEIGELNRRQIMALDLLLAQEVKIMAMAGRAGTGKTSLALNIAIKQIQFQRYENLILSRPRVQAGSPEEELGYLPGDTEEKTMPFLQPFFDNERREHSFQYEVLPLSMIQGRNIKHSIWVITEFQNVRKEDVDAIVERLGEGSKLIVEGDINQNNRTSKEDGLSFLINNLKDEKAVGSIVLNEVERSDVAQLGEKLREAL